MIIMKIIILSLLSKIPIMTMIITIKLIIIIWTVMILRRYYVHFFCFCFTRPLSLIPYFFTTSRPPSSLLPSLPWPLLPLPLPFILSLCPFPSILSFLLRFPYFRPNPFFILLSPFPSLADDSVILPTKWCGFEP